MTQKKYLGRYPNYFLDRDPIVIPIFPEFLVQFIDKLVGEDVSLFRSVRITKGGERILCNQEFNYRL